MQTQDDSKQWIKNKILSNQDSNSWRSRYLSRLGISKQLKQGNNQIDNEINQKSNFKIQNSYSLGQFNLNFLSKTDQEVRNNYIKKLQINKILKKEPTKKYQSSLYYSLVIIFDWDDTILSTTYLSSVGLVQISSEVKNQLEQLDISAVNLPYYSYGNIFIITNATEGWVQYSSKLYLPKVNKVLNQNPIKIISARNFYEDKYPEDCHKWKVEAFKDVKKDFDIQLITNLICLGDSHIQMDAARILGKQFNQPLIKTIKFKQNPRPEELIKQQELVFQRFQQIYMSIKNLTIRLQKQNNDYRKSTQKKTPNDE